MNVGAGLDVALSRPPAWKAWLVATRPHTLGASLIPVLVGGALATQQDRFVLATFSVCALAAIALQITTNLANDAFDYLRKVDTQDRVGPTRVTQAGWLSARQVLVAVGLSIGVALACGAYLVTIGGLPILIIGLVSIIAALGYSAGPFPLASHGLGEVAAFLFFGVVAVMGSAYLHTGAWTALDVAVSLPIGALVSAIMLVNNTRDVATDERCGKRTLAVRIGEPAARALYATLIASAYALSALLAWGYGSLALLLPLLSLPIAWTAVQKLRSARAASEFNGALVATARLHSLYGALLCLGLAR